MPSKTTSKTIFDTRYAVLVDNLVATRKERGHTQRTLAKALGVSNCYIARVETKERRLDVIEIVDYLRVLGLENDEIIEFLKIAM